MFLAAIAPVARASGETRSQRGERKRENGLPEVLISSGRSPARRGGREKFAESRTALSASPLSVGGPAPPVTTPAVVIYAPVPPRSAVVYNYAIFSRGKPYFFVPGDAPGSKSARHRGAVGAAPLEREEDGVGTVRRREDEVGGERERESERTTACTRAKGVCQGDDPLGVPRNPTS